MSTRVIPGPANRMPNFLHPQELLKLFGIPFLESPGEAEAQCAFLEKTKVTDGTITEDSDIWLFGGRMVYKHVFCRDRSVRAYNHRFIYQKLGNQIRAVIHEQMPLRTDPGSDDLHSSAQWQRLHAGCQRCGPCHCHGDPRGFLRCRHRPESCRGAGGIQVSRRR